MLKRVLGAVGRFENAMKTQKEELGRKTLEIMLNCSMEQNRLIKTAAVLIISIASVKAQLWVGSDNFNSATLDSSKWTVWGGPNFVKTPTSVSFISTTSVGTVGDGIYWNQSLPTNQNWIVTVEASISPSFSTSSSANFVEALLTISSDIVNLNSYFTNCLHRDNTFDIVPNWSANGSPNQEILSTIGLSSVVLKMDYNASSKVITSSYADISTPTNFVITKSLDVSNWLNMSGGFKVLVGGYSNDAAISSGLLNMDNFVVGIPEPSALSLLAVGLGGLAMMRRRRS